MPPAESAAPAAPAPRPPGDLLHAVTAGVVTSLVGFTGAFAIVLAGLRAVGATTGEAASGLLVVTILMGLCTLLLSVWQRIPVVVAWSTPGAALLVATGASHGGWPDAVGAFLVCGLLLALVGVWAQLGRWIGLIPVQVASAMLAGVLFHLCLTPILALPDAPALIGPVVVVWLAAYRFARRWAAPLAMLVAFGLSYTSSAVRGIESGPVRPAPGVDPARVQPRGAGVHRAAALCRDDGLAEHPGRRGAGELRLSGTGAADHARDRSRHGAGSRVRCPCAQLRGDLGRPVGRTRGWSGPGAALAGGRGLGCFNVGLGLISAGLVAIVVTSPHSVILAAAGLALLPTFAASLRGAFGPDDSGVSRVEAGAVTFLVAASGVTVFNVGAAFWGLVAGVVVSVVLARRTQP